MAGDWERVARFIRGERAQRKMSRPEFAAAIGVSVRSLGSLERGKTDRYDSQTHVIIEEALGWRAGSLERVLAGGNPADADPERARIAFAWPHLSRDARRMLAASAESAISR